MKGTAEIVRLLNDQLRGELTAINQYFLHASMYRNWGFERLYKKMYDESIEEMKHADALIARILFLEGTPTMSDALKIAIGRSTKEMLENDLKLESEGLPELRQGIALCLEKGDNVTRDLLEKIMVDSEAHVHWLESQLALIKQVGVENYCAQQIHG